MNTELETFFADTLLQLGHVGALSSQLLQQIGREDANPTVMADLKFRFWQHDEALIEHLHQAETGLREVQILVDEWIALARARLQ